MEMQISVIGIISCMSLIFFAFKVYFNENQEEKVELVDGSTEHAKKSCSGNCGCQGRCGGGDNCRCKLKSLKELHA